jgi:carboxyl-terminal processing protease
MAKYYTPGKKTIHEVGVSPDIEVPISDAEERRIVLAQAKRPLTPEEQNEAAKVEDRQLERAVGSLRSILIYKAKQTALNAPPKPIGETKPPAPKSADAAPTPDAAR